MIIANWRSDMNNNIGSRKPCGSGHALAIARLEDNRQDWLEGKFFGLASKRKDLQDLVGKEGTLWIIVSRRQQSGSRMYSLSFRLDKCRAHTYKTRGRFGQYAVVGDPNYSTLFASNDARLLLLGLRFDPTLPIDDKFDRLKIIGKSIQRPRCLNKADIKLLSDFGAEADRWSVFVSYQRNEKDTIIAKKLSEALHAHGVHVFRDQEALRAGQKWWPTLKRAIDRARHFVLVIGNTTYGSPNVEQEVRYAIDRGVNLIPLLAGGTFEHWSEFHFDELQAVFHKRGKWNETIREVLRVVQRTNIAMQKH